MPDGLTVRIGSTTYDAKRKQFKQGGRAIARAAVRGEIDKLTEHVAKRAASIGKRYASGSINLAQFEIEMRELIKSGHIVASSVGRGGRERMSLSDWGVTGNKLKVQYQFLANMITRFGFGQIAKVKAPLRAQAYASSLLPMYYKMVFVDVQNDPNDTRPKVRRELNAKESCGDCIEWAAKGFMSVDAMPELGSLECLQFCKCHLIFEGD